MKYWFLPLLSFLLFLSDVTGQNLWRNTSLVGGAALGEQDRRLFFYPTARNLLAHNPKKLDHDLTLYLEKRVVRWHPLELDAGIGYAESITLFGRPFEHAYLNGGNSLDLRYIKKYTINKLILPVSGKIHIWKFYLQATALPAISFRKSVVQTKFDKRLTKWQFAWNSLEINPGLGFQFSDRLQVSLSYRWLYFHEIDEVIFNGILFYEHHNDGFLQQKTDTYNPFKMWLTVGYKLKK